MNIYYFYIVLLLTMFVLIYKGVDYSFNHAPIKIRIISLSALIIIAFRYIALVILLITKNVSYLYLMKPLVFVNIACLPVLAITAMYILARNDKIKFDYCMILSAVIFILYITMIVKLPVSIKSYENMGYIMTFINNDFAQFGSLIINTMLLFGSIMLLGSKNIDSKGIWLIIIASAIAIAELIVRSCGIIILPAVLIGDICWIFVLNYSLYKFKK